MVLTDYVYRTASPCCFIAPFPFPSRVSPVAVVLLRLLLLASPPTVHSIVKLSLLAGVVTGKIAISIPPLYLYSTVSFSFTGITSCCCSFTVSSTMVVLVDSILGIFCSLVRISSIRPAESAVRTFTRKQSSPAI